ncbi:MAG: FtsX-like permease family protein [Bacillota bacterium]|nr:FtsX-like permease family protein [Bacillota bacterium]
MSLLKIALNNLKVRKMKMLFVLIGMLVGTATIVALFTITMAMEKELEDRFDLVGARIVLSPAAEKISFSYRGISASDNIAVDVPFLTWESLKPVMASEEWQLVELIAPKLLAALEYDDKTMLALGVDFEQEQKLKRYWQVEGEYPNDGNQLVLGYQLAQKLQAVVGQSLQFEGKNFFVAGILEEIGNEEDLLLYISLAALQDMTNNKDVLSLVEVSIPSSLGEDASNDFISFVNTSSSEIVATQVKDAVEARRDLVERFARFSMMVAIVVTLIGSLIVGSTMMASVNERTREIGVFRAIGFRKYHVVKILFFEAGILSGLAGLGGFLVGMLIAVVAAPLIGEIQANVEWNLVIALMSIGLTILVGILASLYPAIKAAKLDPVEALRFI